MFENQSYNVNTQSFIGYVQNGKIFNSFGQQLGVTSEEYTKAIETAKGFEKILYEKGILKKPKTTEEINQELQIALKQTQEMMCEMSQTIASLNNEVKTLKENKDVQQANSDESGKQISKPSKSPNGRQSV